MARRDLGVADQFMDVLAILRVEGDANTGRHEDLLRVDLHWQGQLLGQAPGHEARLFAIRDIRQQHREYVGADPAENVRFA